jgi:hypothetical protein
MVHAFWLTAYTTAHHPQMQFDNVLFIWLQSIRSAQMTHLMIAVTFFGSRYFLFPCYAVLVIYYLFSRKRFWFAVAIALTGFLVNQLLFYARCISSPTPGKSLN